MKIVTVACSVVVPALCMAADCSGRVDEPFISPPADVAVDEGGFVDVDVEEASELIDVSEGLSATLDKGTLTIGADINSIGGAVKVSYPCDDSRCDDEIAVTVKRLGFTRAVFDDEGPSAREHGAMFTSVDGKTLFLVGGGGYPNFPTQEVFADTWQLDVESNTWSEWTTTGDVPPAGASRRAAQAGADVYLHGGYDGASLSLDGLFHVDVTTGVFTELEQVNAPPARMLHAFAFDAAANAFTVFGGFSAVGDNQDILADTWKGTLSGTTVTWEEVTPAFSPSPRYGMFFGFDEAERRFVVFSGAGFPSGADPINAAQDAWSFDVDEGTWLDLLPSDDGEVPIGRRNGCGVLDPARHTLFIFGGTADGRTTAPGAFLLDIRGDGAWHTLDRDGEPPLRSSSFGTAMPTGGVTCGYGNDADLFTDVFTLAPQ